jgi:hypothetical protein
LGGEAFEQVAAIGVADAGVVGRLAAFAQTALAVIEHSEA